MLTYTGNVIIYSFSLMSLLSNAVATDMKPGTENRCIVSHPFSKDTACKRRTATGVTNNINEGSLLSLDLVAVSQHTQYQVP